MTDVRYAAFFCEENVWQLAQRTEFSSRMRRVVFISHPSGQTHLWKQRANPTGFVVWDYHVILAVDDLVFDLDSTLPFPVERTAYFESTFGPQSALPESRQAKFRILDAATFIAKFHSDRTHMKSQSGQWLETPPPWPEIKTPEPSPEWALPALLRFDAETSAPWFSLPEALKLLATEEPQTHK